MNDGLAARVMEGELRMALDELGKAQILFRKDAEKRSTLFLSPDYLEAAVLLARAHNRIDAILEKGKDSEAS